MSRAGTIQINCRVPERSRGTAAPGAAEARLARACISASLDADPSLDFVREHGLWIYALGLGSNRSHGRHGRPSGVLRAATSALAGQILACSATFHTAPLGPCGRRFANAAVLLASPLAPAALLSHLKDLERGFGRRPGRRWGARVLDLDLLLWSGGRVRSRALTVPHPALARRRFALDPLVEVAPDWRVPGVLGKGGGAVRQLRARLTRARPIHR